MIGSNRVRPLHLTLGALAAALAVGAPAPVTLPQDVASAAAVTREALPPEARTQRPAKARAPQPHPDAPRGRWTFFRDGAVDPLGNVHSYRALRRELLGGHFGAVSGRQWRKLRKQLRREAPTLAGASVPELIFGAKGRAR